MPVGFESMVCEFIALIAEWNEYAGLVSRGDIAHLVERHVADSLGLVPIISRILSGRDGALLDIGSGAGFPVIPIKLVLPRLSVTAVERTEKKCSFLKRAVRKLGIERMEVVHGSFPADVPECDVDVITARAVEKPLELWPGIVEWMPGQSTFLCQSGTFPDAISDSARIDVVDDEWDSAGYRRGKLYIVRKITENAESG